MSDSEIATMAEYRRHARRTLDWLLASERPTGGSAAYRIPGIRWSRAYPETTGYLIPTLVESAARFQDERLINFARRCGRWLLSIQNPDGSWNAGRHPPKSKRPSIFNTGQILLGLHALWLEDGDSSWLDGAGRGAKWLESGLEPGGLWSVKDYRSPETPSYYTHALWPMLLVAREIDDIRMVGKIEESFSVIRRRIDEDGWIRKAAFSSDAPAFTHTIVYTIRGFQEGARLLENPKYADAVRPSIEKMVRLAELEGGRLPGAFRAGWQPSTSSICLTGNAQLARSILILEKNAPDLRLVNAAARLVDVVCATQRRLGRREPRGHVAGSSPPWGPYMRFRHPNWAAKYHVDALCSLIDRLEQEL